MEIFKNGWKNFNSAVKNVIQMYYYIIAFCDVLYSCFMYLITIYNISTNVVFLYMKNCPIFNAINNWFDNKNKGLIRT